MKKIIILALSALLVLGVLSCDGSVLSAISEVSVTGISLNKTSTSVTAGSTETLTVTVTPDNATDKTVTWTSSDTSVATVSDGTVTGVAVGTATITATAGDCSATCEITVNYAVGNTGPAGGIVFYDKGSYSDGWRYLEAAPADLRLISETTPSVDSSADGYSSGTTGIVFGYYRLDGTTNTAVGTETAIGTGASNTESLVDAMGEAAYTDSSTTPYYAARMCSELSYGSYSDWFLPSKDELAEMYDLRTTIGNFTDQTYWSSSEESALKCYEHNFDNNVREGGARSAGFRVRPIRAF